MEKKPVQQNRKPPANNAPRKPQSSQHTPQRTPQHSQQRGAKKNTANYKQSDFVKSKGNLPGKPLKNKKRPFGKKTAPQRNAPYNQKADRELSRVMAEKAPASKKRKNRGKNYILYYILAAAVVVVVLIILANTVLFRLSDIEVTGNVRYLPENIIQGSQLKTGENLLYIDEAKTAQNIVDKCLFVDEAEVRKSFPTKVIITVKEAETCFILSENGINAEVSRGGRVIEQTDTAEKDGVITLKGYEPESLELGAWLKSTNEAKTEFPWEMLEIIDKTKLENVTEIDMTDRYSPKVYIDGGRILLNLGSSTELESKFIVAKNLIEQQIGAEEKVVISLSNPEKPGVRPINDNIPPVPEQPAEPENSAPDETQSSNSSQG